MAVQRGAVFALYLSREAYKKNSFTAEANGELPFGVDLELGVGQLPKFLF